MTEVASASLNTFGPSPKTDFVPSSEQLITLTIGQLQDIVTQAVEKAIQPLQDRVSEMEDRIGHLHLKLASLESTEEQDVSRLAADIAYDRQRITKLEQRPPTAPPATPKGDKTTARIAKLKDFLKARGGGATFQEVERLLGIRPNQMTKLVSQLDMRSFEVFARAGDSRQRIIRLKTRI